MDAWAQREWIVESHELWSLGWLWSILNFSFAAAPPVEFRTVCEKMHKNGTHFWGSKKWPRNTISIWFLLTRPIFQSPFGPQKWVLFLAFGHFCIPCKFLSCSHATMQQLQYLTPTIKKQSWLASCINTQHRPTPLQLRGAFKATPAFCYGSRSQNWDPESLSFCDFWNNAKFTISIKRRILPSLLFNLFILLLGSFKRDLFLHGFLGSKNEPHMWYTEHTPKWSQNLVRIWFVSAAL